MKKYLFFSLLIFCQSLSAQSQSKKERQYNVHKFEVGIDFKYLFSWYNSIGTSLIFKKRIGEKRFVSTNEKKALRLQLGVLGSSPVNKFNKYDITGLSYRDLLDYSAVNFGVSGSVGIEWQRQVKRVQYFYGISLGAGIGKRQELGNAFGVINADDTGIDGYELDIRKGYSVNITGFGGVKYFISPEFSLSIESGFGVGYHRNTFEVQRIDVTNQQETTNMLQAKNEINYQLIYLRYLNFSYYF